MSGDSDPRQWSDEEIVEYLKSYWECDDFVFSCKIDNQPYRTKNPEKYKGSITNISYNRRLIYYPNSRTPIFFNISATTRHKFNKGIFFIRFELEERERREYLGNMFQLRPIYASIAELNEEKLRDIGQKRAEAGKSEHTDKEKELFEYWGVDDCAFIGKYEYDEENGTSLVSDIRKPNFAKIPYYPHDPDKTPISIYFPNQIKGITSGDYYLFNWKLAENDERNPYKIHIDFSIPPQPIRPQWFVEQLFDDRYNDKSKNFESAANFLDTLKKQLSAKESTFIYELLQNANDYPRNNDPVDVEFHITDHYLIFMHTGDYFNVRNISGICGINEKEKTANRKAIGYKGIGFKTVFLNNHYVYIRTGDYSFRFEENSPKIKRLEAPWPILPIWTDKQDVPSEVAKVFDQASPKFRVKIALRPEDSKLLHTGRRSYETLFKEVFLDSNLILFIPNLRSVKVFIQGELVRDCFIDEGRWLVSHFEEGIDPDFQVLVNKAIDTGKSRIPEKYKDFDCTKVSFACQKVGRKLVPIEDAHLYCYLPTSASWGFPFLMNTDMIPKGDRDDIEREVYLTDEDETNFNLELARIAGEKFFEWIQKLVMSGDYDYDSIFSLIPNFKKCIKESDEKYEDFITKFQEGFESKMAGKEIVPVLINKKLEFKSVEEIIYDTTGLSSAGFLTDEEILELSSWKDYFPHPTLRDYTKKSLSTGIKSFLATYHIKEQEYTFETIQSVCGDDPFQEWLKVQSNNDKFLLFLLEKDAINLFKNKPIFLTDEGSLLTPQGIYYSLDNYYDDIASLSEFFKRLSLQTRSVVSNNKKWEEFKDNFAEFDPDSFVDSILLKKTNFSKVHAILCEKNASVAFMRFLAKNVGFDEEYKKFPFIDQDGSVVKSFTEKDFNFLPKGDEASIRKEPWANDDWIAIVSPDYCEESLEYFQKHFGVRKYSEATIAREIICGADYSFSLNLSLDNLETNKAFFEFVFRNKGSIGDGDLSSYNLSVVDKDGDTSFETKDDESIFLRNKEYNEFESLPWVDYDFMYAVDTCYYEGYSDAEERKEFITNKYGIPVITAKDFIDGIVLKCVDAINKNLADADVNISFWRWTKDNIKEAASIPGFAVFNLLVKQLGEEEYSQYDVNGYYMYLSDDYQPASDIEAIVLKYAPDALFVASDYMENGTAGTLASWMEFFKNLGVKTTIVDLLFEQIIPNVGDIQEDGLPNLLGRYYSDIQDRWDDVKESLLNICVKTRDGEFTGIKDCILIDVSKEKEPFPDIVFASEIEPGIIANRNTRKILLDIGEEAGALIVNDITQWQDNKISEYAGNEDQYDTDAHLRIVDELSRIDIETVKTFSGLKDLRLLGRDDEYYSPDELTLGDIYTPQCLFEANGITEDLNFISDKYTSINKGNAFYEFTTRALDIHYRFEKDDIDLLENYKFAIYFWSVYSLRHYDFILDLIDDGELEDVPCVPTMAGNVYSPGKVYARSMTEFVVKRIEQWEDKLPSDQIPENKNKDNDLLNRLGCLDQLTFEDGLMALQTIKSKDKRKIILEWMNDDYDSSKKGLIDAYRSDEGAIWKNGRGDDKHISALYALAPESSTLREFFRDNEYILNLEYITYYLNPDKYRSICDMLQIHIIEEDEMDFVPVGSPDEKLKLFLENRLLIVAGIETPEGWRKAFDKYKKKLEDLSFWNCSVISWTYRDNKDICQTTKKFYAKDGVFYFVNDWSSRQVYTNFINALHERLNCDLNLDQFSEVLDPDMESDEIIEPYYTLRTDEFISELASYEDAYNSYQGPINTGEDDEDDNFFDAYRPGQYTDPSHDQDGSFEETESSNDNENDIPVRTSSTSPVSYDSKPSTSSGTIKPQDVSTSDSTRSPEGTPQEEIEHTEVAPSESSHATVPQGSGDGKIAGKHSPKDTQPVQATQEENDEAVDGFDDLEPLDDFSEDDNWEAEESSAPTRTTRTRRAPKNYSQRQYERLASVGIPLELESLPPTDEEIDILGQYGITPEQIADSNYLAQLRLYRNLINDEHEEPEETMEEFIRNADKVTTHKLKGDKYVQARSAARGVLYISPSVWEKLMDNKWRICVYLDGQGKNFHYINSAEEFLNLVNKDDIVIKITGKEKVDVVNELYSGVLNGVKGTAYTLIRVASHTNMDAAFARYVGEMAEKNDGNENSEEY